MFGGEVRYSSGGSSPGLAWARVLGLGVFTVDLGLVKGLGLKTCKILYQSRIPHVFMIRILSTTPIPLPIPSSSSSSSFFHLKGSMGKVVHPLRTFLTAQLADDV